jgi:hypothetical protein
MKFMFFISFFPYRILQPCSIRVLENRAHSGSAPLPFIVSVLCVAISFFQRYSIEQPLPLKSLKSTLSGKKEEFLIALIYYFQFLDPMIGNYVSKALYLLSKHWRFKFSELRYLYEAAADVSGCIYSFFKWVIINSLTERLVHCLHSLSQEVGGPKGPVVNC